MPAPSPIISTARTSSIPTACRRRSLAEVLRWQFGGGRKRAKWPDWVPNAHCRHAAAARRRRQGAAVVRRPRQLADPDRAASTSSSIRCGRSAPRRCRFAGPKRHNVPASPSTRCRRSTSCWCRTAITTISTSRRCRSLPRAIRAARDHAARQRRHDARATIRAIRAEGFDWHDRVELGNGVAVTLVPTRHWSARGLFDRNKALWASFVLETPAGKLYIVGDSGYGDGAHFRRVARDARPAAAGAAADRRLRAALVHEGPAHEPGGCREGAGRLRRASRRWRITTARSSSPMRRSTRRRRAG